MADAIETKNNENPVIETVITNPATPDPKEQELFSKDYVQVLRKEAEKYRKEKNTYATSLRQILEVEDLDGLDEKMATYKQKREKELADAHNEVNAYIINQEINKALGDEYTAAARKLLNREKITVKDGKVEGLTEAIEDLVKEYPEVKKNQPGKLAEGTGTGKVDNKADDEGIKNFRKMLGLKD